jgi:hypothetical protein
MRHRQIARGEACASPQWKNEDGAETALFEMARGKKQSEA